MNNTDAQNKAIHAGAKKIKVSVAAQPHEIGHIIEDHKGNILERHEGEGRFSLGAKTKALRSRKEVIAYSKERKANTKKTGWEESGTGSRFIPKAFR